MTDQQVYDLVKVIVKSDCPTDEKYQQLDRLTFQVWNHHPDHMAATGPLEAIHKAIDELQKGI